MTKPQSADNKPFDFNLDAYQSEVELLPFRFNWRSKRWTMEHAENLDTWGLIAASSDQEITVLVDIFRAAMGEEQFEEFKKFPLPQGKLKGLFDAYMAHCNVDPGEFSASTS